MKTLQEQRTEAVLKMQERISELEKENAELNDEVRKLKLLVSSLVYEINQIWDINEMNDDLRMCAEKIDREVRICYCATKAKVGCEGDMRK
jgi:predicted nuclease with TOPRIM domain